PFIYVSSRYLIFSLFLFDTTSTTEIYTLSLHDALPIYGLLQLQHVRPELRLRRRGGESGEVTSVTRRASGGGGSSEGAMALKKRSEEHTSELQSPCNLVCRLLLEKKKKKKNQVIY